MTRVGYPTWPVRGTRDGRDPRAPAVVSCWVGVRLPAGAGAAREQAGRGADADTGADVAGQRTLAVLDLALAAGGDAEERAGGALVVEEDPVGDGRGSDL